MRRPVLQPRLSLFWRALPPALCLLLATLYTPISAQIAVPDRLPDGRRMTAFTTPAEFGHLPFDSLRRLGYSEDELERRATEVKKREDRKKRS